MENLGMNTSIHLGGGKGRGEGTGLGPSCFQATFQETAPAGPCWLLLKGQHMPVS